LVSQVFNHRQLISAISHSPVNTRQILYVIVIEDLPSHGQLQTWVLGHYDFATE